MKTQLVNFYRACRRLYLFKRDRHMALSKQKKCEHVKSMVVVIPGNYGPVIPHPHPLFADKLKVQIQPLARVCVCFKCEKVFADFIYNQKDADLELPLEDKSTVPID